MDLRARLEKNADAPPLREFTGVAAERLMGPEAGAKAGAEHGEKTPGRLAQRNVDRDRDWRTRAGTGALRTPRLRSGSRFAPSSNPAAPSKRS